MDVVNLSLGSPIAWWMNYPTAVAADNLAKAGVTVIAAQGNDGHFGIFSGGVPASAHDAIAVGSVFNAATEQDAFSVEQTCRISIGVWVGVASWLRGSRISCLSQGSHKRCRQSFGDPVAVRHGVVTYYKNKLSGGIADEYFSFGRADDVALAGDWDGDGLDSFTVLRGGIIFVNNVLTGGLTQAQNLRIVGDQYLVGGLGWRWRGYGWRYPLGRLSVRLA